MLERSRVARQTGGEPSRALSGGDASAVLTVGGRVGQVNTGKGSECRRSRKGLPNQGNKAHKDMVASAFGGRGAENASREGQESRLERPAGARLGKASCFLSWTMKVMKLSRDPEMNHQAPHRVSEHRGTLGDT